MMYFIFRCLIDGGNGIPYGGLHFPGTGSPMPDVGNINFVCND